MRPSLIADRYHVLRELGRGGMGVVYHVLHKQTGEQHALKVLLGHKAAKGDSVERFKRELKLPARIQSEYVVQVTDSGEVKEEDGAPFYVMELLRGCDLRKLLDTQHPFTPREVLWILRQLAHGLGKAHEIGIVHRDLKPDNIFLHVRGDGGLVVKILDFGIARYAQELLDTGDKEKLTATQAMLGTPLYMAPEQAKAGEGRAEIGPCTDVWAVGMIVFELLTGRPYWNANSLVAHIGQLLFAPMAPASQRGAGLPPGFDAWFARSCSRDGSQRYQTIAEQIHDLASLLMAATPDADPPGELVAAVQKQIPPLVDHRSPTAPAERAEPTGSGPAAQPESQDGETRILAQSRLLPGGSEQALRAELVSRPQETPRTVGVSTGTRKGRVLVAGVAFVGAGALAVVLMGNKSGSVPRNPGTAADLAAGPTELPRPVDLSASSGSDPAMQPAALPNVRKPQVESKRPRAAKAAKPAEPQQPHGKPRRTYVPPSL